MHALDVSRKFSARYRSEFSAYRNPVCRAAFIVVAGIFALSAVVGCGENPRQGGGDAAKGKSGQVTIAMLPKLTSIAYFKACHTGAKSAAEELGVNLIYDGPTEASGSKQNEFIETWIRQGVDAICVAPNQPATIRSAIEKAKQRGIKVLTWDSDAPESGRTLMVNQVDDQKLGELLMDETAKQMNE